MSEALIAARGPYRIEIEAGREYFWCACGRSKSQPFCDGSHKDTGFQPIAYRAEASGPAWFCGCKRSGTQPLCDGTHNSLD